MRGKQEEKPVGNAEQVKRLVNLGSYLVGGVLKQRVFYFRLLLKVKSWSKSKSSGRGESCPKLNQLGLEGVCLPWWDPLVDPV